MPHSSPISQAPIETRTEKARLRLEALARRDALDPGYRATASRALALSAPALGITPGLVVSGFWPVRSEIDARPLMAALGEAGARLCLPAILDGRSMIFREMRPNTRLVPMGFGTLGPPPDAAVAMPQIMLIPLAAFDSRGHRIGYGAGFYDRAIAAMRRDGRSPRLVGLAFDCQAVDAVPEEAHDVSLDELLTESGLRRFPRP